MVVVFLVRGWVGCLVLFVLLLCWFICCYFLNQHDGILIVLECEVDLDCLFFVFIHVRVEKRNGPCPRKCSGLLTISNHLLVFTRRIDWFTYIRICIVYIHHHCIVLSTSVLMRLSPWHQLAMPIVWSLGGLLVALPWVLFSCGTTICWWSFSRVWSYPAAGVSGLWLQMGTNNGWIPTNDDAVGAKFGTHLAA